MSLVQLTKVTLSCERVPRGQNPVFQLDLDDDRRIVSVEYYWSVDQEHRQTVDHFVVVWVEWRG